MLAAVTVAPTPYRKLPALERTPHPFPYQGSKRALAHAIVPLIPSGTRTLVEPFAGSGAVSIAARVARRNQSTTLVDVNEPLMGLWSVVLERPSWLAAQYERMWQEQLDDPRAYYDAVRAEFNETQEPNLLLYLLNRCVKAAVRYGKDGRFNQSADHRRLGAKPGVVRDRLIQVSGVMSGSQAAAGDYAEYLLGAGPQDVVYMDPPYQGVTNVRDHRYMRGLMREDFEDVLQEAVARGVSFIISYDVVTDDAKYGEPLEAGLGLTHLHITAGRSSQATLLGKEDVTVESLYLSPALMDRLGGRVEGLLSA